MTASAALARVLAAQRSRFNQRVAETRHRLPAFDTAAFKAFLVHQVDAVAVAVDAVDPAATPEAVAVAYDIGLDLVGQGLAGPAARLPWVDLAWQRLPPAIAALVAGSPLQALGTVTNAVVRMGSVPGARVEQWVERMSALAGGCADVAALRRLGALCAWRCGMTHLRRGALEQAANLPPALALAALGAPPSSDWDTVGRRLEAQPWWNPGADEAPAQGWTVGGFTGLGGPFAAPPQVRGGEDGFVVASGGRHHLLLADAFGAVVLPATAAEFEGAASTVSPKVRIAPEGVHIDGRPVAFDVPEDGLQAVSNATSVAVFSPWSHRIRVLPLAS
ncbi:hypothetical protein OK348_12125 [Flavobacterium sp. MXW15]|uniref:DUF2264 domain-containing protein n=1 Tax=Xanthomonas chitinilytica TaxID=2989819 RepID=A0ABT3JY56_9XANT|nr:hypothetical protein [Xanthomonas sp. H13-6]MCW4455533.1 hypothetical protein [Flavobacterium sp. MXW15]MCW4473386.1 hypothetical protein [Xanthomonas sp. H13-6]